MAMLKKLRRARKVEEAREVNVLNTWIETTIGDQVMLQRGIDITLKDQRPGRIPVISSGGVSSYHETAAAKGPGVILGRKGTIGTVFFIKTDYWPHVLYRTKNETELWS